VSWETNSMMRVPDSINISVIYSHFVVTFMSTCNCAQIHLVIFYYELLRVVIFITSLQILVSCQSHICYVCFPSLYLCMCVGICSCKQVSLTGFSIIKFMPIPVAARSKA
jgi:hypothetical protein